MLGLQRCRKAVSEFGNMELQLAAASTGPISTLFSFFSLERLSDSELRR